MRRLLLPLVLTLGLTGAAVATTTPASAAAAAKTYTVARTFGPYNGAVPAGSGLPGSTPDHESRVVSCGPGASIVAGSARVNRKTTYGTTPRAVLTVDVIGAFWNSEVDALQWGAWINPTGRKGWNSVTFTITCRRS